MSCANSSIGAGYPERDWNTEYIISENIGAGKRPDQWLEGTSLRESFRLLADGKTPPPANQRPEITQQDLASLLDGSAIAGLDQSPEKADEGKMSLRDLQHSSPDRESRGKDQKSKSRDMER